MTMNFLDLPSTIILNLIKHSGWQYYEWVDGGIVKGNYHYRKLYVAQMLDTLIQIGCNKLNHVVLESNCVNLCLDKKSHKTRLHQCADYGTGFLLCELKKLYETSTRKQIELDQFVLKRAIRNRNENMTNLLLSKFGMKVDPSFYLGAIAHIPTWTCNDNAVVKKCLDLKIKIPMALLLNHQELTILHAYLIEQGLDESTTDVSLYLGAYCGNSFMLRNVPEDSRYSFKMDLAMECGLLGRHSNWNAIWQPYFPHLTPWSLIRLFAPVNNGQLTANKFSSHISISAYVTLLTVVYYRMTDEIVTHLLRYHCAYDQYGYAKELIAMVDFYQGNGAYPMCPTLKPHHLDEAIAFNAFTVVETLHQVTAYNCTENAKLAPDVQVQFDCLTLEMNKLIVLLRVGYFKHHLTDFDRYLTSWIHKSDPCIKYVLQIPCLRQYLFDFLSKRTDSFEKACEILNFITNI
jgi:hypothetical protein